MYLLFFKYTHNIYVYLIIISQMVRTFKWCFYLKETSVIFSVICRVPGSVL